MISNKTTLKPNSQFANSRFQIWFDDIRLKPFLYELKKLESEKALQFLSSLQNEAKGTYKSTAQGKLHKTETADEITLETSHTSIKTVEEALEYAKIDLDRWEVTSATTNVWEMAAKDANDNIVVQPLYQVKLKLKPKKVVNPYSSFNYLQEIKVSEIPHFTEIKTNFEEDLLLEVASFDKHYGKLAWAPETGDNYDLQIAATRVLETTATLLKRVSGFNIGHILYSLGNDQLNSNNYQNETAFSKHIQDEDGRWQKVFNVALETEIQVIKLLLQKNKPIHIKWIPGNHDWERSYYLAKALEAYFKDEPLIVFDVAPAPRKYFKFGKVLLGYTHAALEKEADLPMLMATEASEFWSDTLYREWHLGHYHTTKGMVYKTPSTRENFGVMIEYLRSIAGTDAWHNMKGYVGNIKGIDAFLFDKNHGRIAKISVCL